jgi:hypothetical protein
VQISSTTTMTVATRTRASRHSGRVHAKAPASVSMCDGAAACGASARR